jgi:hypothetical protein
VLTDADDDVAGNGAVAVASYSWWQRHGKDPAIVGKSVTLKARITPSWASRRPGFSESPWASRPISGFLFPWKRKFRRAGTASTTSGFNRFTS